MPLSPLRPAFLLSDLQSGGTELFALRLARGLKEQGLTPIFILMQEKGELLPSVRQEFEVVTLTATRFSVFAFLRVLPALRRAVAETKPDVLITGLLPLSLCAALAKVFSPRPFRLLLIEHMRLEPFRFPGCHSVMPPESASLSILSSSTSGARSARRADRGPRVARVLRWFLITLGPRFNFLSSFPAATQQKKPKRKLPWDDKICSCSCAAIPAWFFYFIKHVAKRGALRWTHGASDAVVCGSQTVWRDLAALGCKTQSRARVILYPAVPDDVDALAAPPTDHEWLREKTLPVIVAVGRLLPVKDYPTLLEAFALLIKEKPARLLILGEGTERGAIEAQIRALSLDGSVRLLGAQENVFPFLRQADVFALASRSEAFGMVVAEALACGTPVVATDCGGPREILEEGRYGTLCPVGDAPALAAALAIALDAPPDRDALKARGRTFGVRAATDSFAALLREVVGDGR